MILVLTDDQRGDSLGLMPVVTSRLVEQGMYFENAFVTTSLCCPSRASILSGQYAHTHGIVSLGGAPRFDASDTFATWLHDAGYRTAWIGFLLGRLPLLWLRIERERSARAVWNRPMAWLHSPEISWR